MQELRFVAVSEDCSYAVLDVPGRSGRYVLPIDERLRAVALGQTSRLAQYEIEVESPLRPKEIQARIRAGETAEEIADAAGIPVERVRWFEGPVLAERAYIAQQAQTASVRRTGDSSGPGPRLGEVVTERLLAAGSDADDGNWDSRKRGDGNWQVSLTFPSGGRRHVAEWVFDPRRRHVMPDDDNAARLSLPEADLPPEPVALPGEATVTPIASRLSAAAGMGGGAGGSLGGGAGVGGFAGAPGGSRFRPERSVIPDRSLGAERSLADRPHGDWSQAERTHGGLPAPSPSPAPSAAPASAPAGYQNRPAAPQPGYAEFPESAPYRAPEHRAPEHRTPEHRTPEHQAAEPAYREPAAEPAGYRTPAAPADPPAATPAYRDPEPGPVSFRPAEAGDRARDDDRRGYREPAAQRGPGSIPLADYTEPEPAAHRAPAPDLTAEVTPGAPAAGSASSGRPLADGPAFDDSERTQITAPRQIVFEEPEPALLGDRFEPAVDTAPAATAPAAPATAPPALPAPADRLADAPAGAPAVGAPARHERVVSEPVVNQQVVNEPTVSGPAVSGPTGGQTGSQMPATAKSPALAAKAGAPARAADPVQAPQPAANPAPSPALVAQAKRTAPAATAAQPTPPTQSQPPTQSRPAPEDAAAPQEAPPGSTRPQPAEPAAEQAAPATAVTASSEPAAPVAPEPKAEVPVSATNQAAPAANAEVPAPAEAPAEEEPSTRPRPGAKKNAKARRSSVPSWDEVMLGSSRQRE